MAVCLYLGELVADDADLVGVEAPELTVRDEGGVKHGARVGGGLAGGW